MSSPRNGRRSSGSMRSRWRWSSATRVSAPTAAECRMVEAAILDRALDRRRWRRPCGRSSAAIPCSARHASLIRAEALIQIDCGPRPALAGCSCLASAPRSRSTPVTARELLHVPWAQPWRYDPQWLIDDPATDRPPRTRRWPRAGHGYLQHDRRRSPHTVRAYVATAHRLIDFLGLYRGDGSRSGRRCGLCPRPDLRAFLAQRRRAEGLAHPRRRANLSGVRAFLTYAAEQAGSHAELPRTRAPKRPRTLPRPAAPDDAVESCRRCALRRPASRGSARATWRSCCCCTARACGSPRRCR